MADYNVSVDIKNMFADLLTRSRVPHAVLIDGGIKDERTQAAEYLAQWAVCQGDTRPCGECRDCIKASLHSHPDIIVPKSSGKTNIVNMETMRSIIMDASIVTNEADTKVFIIHEADSRMKEDVQNAFLKILEEPPLNTLFILTCESSTRMLSTILSRVQVFSLKSKTVIDEKSDAAAKDIINGILSHNESSLLIATSSIPNHDALKQTLLIVSEYLRQGLSYSVGANTDGDVAKAIASRITKTKIIALIDLTSGAIIKANRNVNLTILSTWLCGEYRRISWQK